MAYSEDIPYQERILVRYDFLHLPDSDEFLQFHYLQNCHMYGAIIFTSSIGVRVFLLNENPSDNIQLRIKKFLHGKIKQEDLNILALGEK
jgi:hypothetical protein